MNAWLTTLPLLHIGGPEPTGPLYTHWRIDPPIAVFIIVITAAYLLWTGPFNRSRPGTADRPVTPAQRRWFMLGQVFLLIALGPPIDDWSYFFFSSVHMVQHLMLMFIVVPCWLKGIPAWVYQPIVRHPRAAWLLTRIPRAVPGFVLASIIIVSWHIPALYNLTLKYAFIHALQHQFFLLTGFLFFWPIMSPVKESPQLSQPMKCLYLFAQTIPSGMVGAFITYASPGLYPHYAQASVRPWGLSIAEDQQIGGLIMWVGMNSVFLVMVTIIFLRWANAEDRKDREANAAGTMRQHIAKVAEPDNAHHVFG